eukprot:GEMP01099535.1.p1 GENE.GEMP01099535.1~~GEMP01099535.1.p1  ORF type:complete len:129 (+),score=30.66 GEMP01099535.1:34-387(+)
MVKDTKRTLEPRTQDHTLNLGKIVHTIQFKKRAPRAIRDIRKFAEKTMKTKDVRIDQKLNKFIWSNGVRNLPKRVRLRLSRRRNEDEDAKESMYTLVQHVPVESYKGLLNEIVQDEE